jgi:hypothetical protein
MHSRARQRSEPDSSQQRLRQLIEGIVTEECSLSGRELRFSVDELAVSGQPPERIRVWATLHFLPSGSPFCCQEPECHLGLWAERLGRVNETLCHRLHLQQKVEAQFVSLGIAFHEGVEFDDPLTGRAPSLDWREVDRRDALGRTALMRAATRGHAHLAEELLTAGADPGAADQKGRCILDLVPQGELWIRTLLEKALAKPKPPGS